MRRKRERAHSRAESRGDPAGSKIVSVQPKLVLLLSSVLGATCVLLYSSARASATLRNKSCRNSGSTGSATHGKFA